MEADGKKMGSPGAGVMNFGRNKSMIVAETDTGVKFGDVAGAEESKDELKEVVDFLENPEKYTAIGGRSPKVFCWWDLPEQVKLFLRGPWREKPRFLFSE